MNLEKRAPRVAAYSVSPDYHYYGYLSPGGRDTLLLPGPGTEGRAPPPSGLGIREKEGASSDRNVTGTIE